MGNYGKSLFERFIENGIEYYLLDVQYRMHPDISEFPIKQFYQGDVYNAEKLC